MRGVVVTVLVSAVVVAGAPAYADHAPSFVVPGRPDVPVIINGRDVSWSVVEGDWGLNRPGHMPLEVYGAPVRSIVYPASGYFPASGRRPAYGRRELAPPPNAPLPPPAPSFQRFWGAASDPAPVTIDPPFNPPAVITAPRQRHQRARRTVAGAGGGDIPNTTRQH